MSTSNEMTSAFEIYSKRLRRKKKITATSPAPKMMKQNVINKKHKDVHLDKNSCNSKKIKHLKDFSKLKKGCESIKALNNSNVYSDAVIDNTINAIKLNENRKTGRKQTTLNGKGNNYTNNKFKNKRKKILNTPVKEQNYGNKRIKDLNSQEVNINGYESDDSSIISNGCQPTPDTEKETVKLTKRERNQYHRNKARSSNNKFPQHSPENKRNRLCVFNKSRSLGESPNMQQSREEWNAEGSSIEMGKSLFEWMMKPLLEKEFMKKYWEKQPMFIHRGDGYRDYYSQLLSTPMIDAMLRQNNIFFTKHLDVTSYSNGERETHNLSGRAQPNVVWDYYANGCSIRLLNPQAFVSKMHMLNTMLQEYFGCFVGANAYLTPPGTQGFAPHYDDIEAFVLQCEGKKQWKVYAPRSKEEELARFSSPNFTQEEIGKPILDITLEPGDLLYFPRGYIHQASTVPGEHSLHITLSAYQRTAWVDLLEKALPIALQKASADDVEFRQGLPRDYLGIHQFGNYAARSKMVAKAKFLLIRMMNYLDLDSAVDQMGAQFLHDSLPPVVTRMEAPCSVLRSGLTMGPNGKLTNRIQFTLDTRVKLLRAHICRVVMEEGEDRLYHSMDNPLEYHADEPQFLVLPPEGPLVIDLLFQNYPQFTTVRDIPDVEPDIVLLLITDLWDQGLLLTDKPLSAVPENMQKDESAESDT